VRVPVNIQWEVQSESLNIIQLNFVLQRIDSAIVKLSPLAAAMEIIVVKMGKINCFVNSTIAFHS
jgi:hypothetical protein